MESVILDTNSISKLSINVGIGCGLVIFFSGGFYYLFGNKLRKFMSRESESVVNEIIKSEDLKKAINHFFGDMLGKEDNVIVQTLEDENIQLKTTNFINKILTNVVNDVEMNKLIKSKLREIMVDEEIKKITQSFIQDIVNNEALINDIKQIILNIFKSEEFVTESRNLAGQLVTDLLNNHELETQLNTYISKLLLTTLDEPVNETTIKNKLIQIVSGDDVINTIANNIIAVSNRQDVKEQVSKNLVEGVVEAIKKHFPSTLGYVF